jgi:hypothetical protein
MRDNINEKKPESQGLVLSRNFWGKAHAPPSTLAISPQDPVGPTFSLYVPVDEKDKGSSSE